MYFLYQNAGFTSEFLVGSLVIMLVAGVLLWVWHHTYYTIHNSIVKFYSGPFRGKIEIKKITKITLNKTSFVGLKFGLARNGIIVESETHMNLYITPAHPKEFIEKLLEVNPQIKITA